MKIGKVTGIGGFFFKCRDVSKTKEWYKKHLGFEVDDYGCTFFMKQEVEKDENASQQWSPFKADTDYFGKSGQEFMINLRVDDLLELLEELKANDVRIFDEVQEFEYGKFAWIEDCDGRRVELWEPQNENLFVKES